MRLFIAVDPSETARRHLAGLGVPSSGAPGLRLSPPEKWHVTLAFLGEVTPEQRASAELAIVRVAADQAGPIRVRVAGGGRFGGRGAVILWAGMAGDIEGLHQLGVRVRQRLDEFGLPYDPRPFQPHLTLCRVGRRYPRSRLAADLAVLSGYTGPEWTLDELRLYASGRPNEPYVQLASASLGEGSRAAEGRL